jgi:hypothetical protein
MSELIDFLKEHLRLSTTGAALAPWLLQTGGVILLLQSLFGMVAIVIFDFSSIRDVTTALCLTLAFPIYLIGLKSLRVATWLLWVFFVLQWLRTCFFSQPPVLVSPFDWWHGDTLFASIVLVQVGYLILSRVSKKGVAINLYNSFAE